MDQPGRFGPFLLFQETGSNRVRSCYRAGITRGRAVERIVRLEVFDRPGFEATELLARIEPSKRIQASLGDPHIATGAGLGQVGLIPWAAYDFELGTTLAAFSRTARERSFPIPLDQALFIAERIALALAAAYRIEHDGEPILHSFLTPETVLLSNVGEVKVSGFETAPALRLRLRGDPDWAPYLSPQCRAGQARQAQDDVFSLGSMLLELVTGEPLSPESPELDTVIVRATGEPAPQSLQDLLRRSLAEPARRIPHVLDWQRSLGKLILDGEYNPTTFNLAFLLHTLLREPLERGVESLEREKRYVLPQGQSPEPAEDAEEAARTVAPEDDSVATVPNAGAELALPEESAGQIPSPRPGPPQSDARPFWLGFSISAIAASAILLGVMVWGGQSNGAALEELESEVMAARPQSPSSRSSSAERPTTVSTTNKPALTLSEVVQGELGGPLDGHEIERTLAERTAEIERNLAAQYEQKLEALRTEMLALRGLEGRDPETSQEAIPATPRAGQPTREPIEDGPAGKIARDETPAAASDPATAAGGPSAPPVEPDPDELREAPAKTQALDQVQVPTRDVSEALPPRGLTERTSTPPAPAVDLPGAGSPSVEPKARPATAPPEVSAPDPTEESSPTVGEIPARLVRIKPPIYPPAARRLGLSATARVQVVISPDGEVLEAKIVGPELGSGFDRAAIQAVRRSRWNPATRAGEPVESTTLVTLHFKP